MSRTELTLALVFLALAAGVVGSMDYEDALAQEIAYCADLREGNHPDYNGLQQTCAQRYWSK